MMKSEADYLLAALAYRDASLDSEIRELSFEQIQKAVVNRIRPRSRPKVRPPISYSDPTGELAVGLASKKVQ